MNYSVVDAKLKNLIQVCKQTENFKKLAVVSFILTSNKVDEVGIKLGIRQRNRVSGEKLFEYMELINEIFKANLKISIFQNDYIEEIRECELLFLRNKGNIPYEHIKTMFHIYYELRKIEVPNLHKSLEGDEFITSSQLGAISFLSPGRRQKQKDSGTLKPLIVQKINERQVDLQHSLQNRLDSQKLETAIYLRSIKDSLLHDKKGRIMVHGALKDNLQYQGSLDSIWGFLIIGLIVLLGSLGIVILIELSFIHIISGELNSLVLYLFVATAVLLFAYIRYYRKGRK